MRGREYSVPVARVLMKLEGVIKRHPEVRDVMWTFAGPDPKECSTEAKQLLSTVRTLQEAFRAESGRYSISLNEIGWTDPTDAKWYKCCRIIKATKDYFLAEAIGIAEPVKGDRWTVDSRRNLQHTHLPD